MPLNPILIREKAVTEREQAADLREKDLLEREYAADLRERALTGKEKAAGARTGASHQSGPVPSPDARHIQTLAEREEEADRRDKALTEREEAANSRDQDLAEREKAAGAREAASSRRDSVAHAREEDADSRDAASDRRDGVADSRDATSDLRDGVAQVRDEAADSRDATSDLREGIAQRREDTADSREVASERRDGLAMLREAQMHLRESAVSSREKMIDDAKAMQAVLEDHMASLQQANDHLITTTAEAHLLTEKVQKAKDRMGYLAHHDSLTDLPNRTLLKERLDQAIAMASRHHVRLVVMFLDLDRFKTVNDSLGHAVGDALLQSVAQRLTAAVRTTDTVSRYGGDEFVVLLSEISDVSAVSALAQNIIKTVEACYAIDGHDLYIGVTIGISVYPENGGNAESLIANADVAMYGGKRRGKRGGKGRYHFFTPEMTT